MTTAARLGILPLSCLAVVLPACGSGTQSPATKITARISDSTEKVKRQTGLLKNEVPAEQLDSVIRAHYQGLGFMEQYEYRKAAVAFREAHERAPGWIPGSINLAIALLNDTGTQEESRKAGGGNASTAGFQQALALLDEVITRDPENLHAHFCRGLILEFLGQGRTLDAHKDFLFVAEHDPTDGHAWLKVGATLTAPENPSQPAGPPQAEKLIEIYSRALDANPYLITAHYKLQQAYGWARKPEKQRELLDRWRKLNPKSNPAGSGDTAEAFYGENGKYARIVNPFGAVRTQADSSRSPSFGPLEAITIAPVQEDEAIVDTKGVDQLYERVRLRFGAAVCTFDADGDGRIDLFLAASPTSPKGVRDRLLLNKGDGRFEDVSKAWGVNDRASLGVAAADFDADRRIDLFLTGPTGYRLLRNLGTKFEDVTAKAGMDSAGMLGLTARWLDLDQDGDLDLYVVNYTDLAHSGQALKGKNAKSVPRVTNTAYRNVGKPAPVSGRPQDNWAPLAAATADLAARDGLSIEFTPWPDAQALLGPPDHYTAVAALDLDDDRDLDLVLGSEQPGLAAVLNDRLGAFHASAMKGAGLSTRPANRILVADFDKDGRSDLATFYDLTSLDLGGGPDHFAVQDVLGMILRNVTDPDRSPREIAWENWPRVPAPWKTAFAADLNLDTWPDLVGLSMSGVDPAEVRWLLNDGRWMVDEPLAPTLARTGLPALVVLALADVVGDALPDLIAIPESGPPLISRNLGNGNHWLALDLGGRWKTSFDHMRTNPHGLGTRLTLQGQGLFANHEHTTPAASLAQSVGPIVLGLGRSPSVELVRLRWPDGTMQCELNQKADVVLKLAETNRKTGSCPVLFTWNGERFVCLGDFLGGGGLGYLVAPGVYGQPDRDESVAITDNQLRPVDGAFRLSITEPMDEVTYLDQLILVVVDRPPGVSSTPDERFAPEGPRPTGESIAWRIAIAPERATDLDGRDLTETLRAWDRKTADGFRRLDGWVGYAEEHGIVLVFGDRLSRFGPKDPLVLALAGWVEYPYSQTNYAAATAGVVLRLPTVERLNEDGAWTTIEPHAGYPAGLPRMTTLDLTGKLNGPRCTIRLRTNMECYWDQAFIALLDKDAQASLRQTALPVSRAALGQRGYTREVSPDGRLPLLYDYDHVDPAPLALMAGRLTRYGDVAPLLRGDDDRFCLVGPGDEVRLEFDAGRLPEPPEGWTRCYVLKAVGYCKDADPFTATSDRVGPLPWRGMPAFPFGSDTRRPIDPAYQLHLDEMQTRPAGSAY